MKKKLIYTSLLLSGLSLIAKVFGFIREALLAHFYGATYITDGYLIAQNIVDTVFCSFTAAIVIGYITVMISKNDNNKTLNTVLNLLFLFFTIIAVFAFVFAPLLIRLFAPGFGTEAINITVKMLRIMLPFSIFYSFLFILSADLQSKNIFWHMGVYNLITNIILVLTVVISNGNYVLLSIGYGVSVIIPTIFVFLINTKKGFKYKLNMYNGNTYLKSIIVVAYPVFFIEVFTKLMVLIDKAFASNLGEGIITDINYANRTITIVLTFFVSIIATVLLPTLVKKAENKDLTEFKNTSEQIALYDMFIIMGITGLIAVCNNDIIKILFLRGAFSLENAQITSQLLFIYSMGLIPLSLNSMLKSQLYALKKSKSTMYFTIISIVLNIILDYFLIRIWGYKGLAIASVVSAFILTILYFVLLFKKLNQNYSHYFYKELAKIVVAAIITFVTGLLVNNLMAISQSIINICVVGIIEVLLYIGVLICLKSDVLVDLWRTLFLRGNKNEKNK